MCVNRNYTQYNVTGGSVGLFISWFAHHRNEMLQWAMDLILAGFSWHRLRFHASSNTRFLGKSNISWTIVLKWRQGYPSDIRTSWITFYRDECYYRIQRSSNSKSIILIGLNSLNARYRPGIFKFPCQIIRITDTAAVSKNRGWVSMADC